MHPERNGSISSSTLGSISNAQISTHLDQLDQLEHAEHQNGHYDILERQEPNSAAGSAGQTETAAIGMSRDDMDETETEGLPHPVDPAGLHSLDHSARGRSVFTTKEFPAGTALEESTVPPLSKEDCDGGKTLYTKYGEHGISWPNGVSETAPASNGTKINEKEVDHETFPGIDPHDLYDIDEVSARQSRLRLVKEDMQLRNLEIFGRSSSNDSTNRSAVPNGEPASAPVELGPVIQEEQVILSPKPVHFSLRSSDISPLPAVTQHENLPAPLHSTPALSPNTPPDLGEAKLVPDIAWNEGYWVSKEGRRAMANDVVEEDCVRIFGPGEQEENEIDTGTSEQASRNYGIRS